MSSITILDRVRNLLGSGSTHLAGVNACANETAPQPARPMSDRELAQVIREFRSATDTSGLGDD